MLLIAIILAIILIYLINRPTPKLTQDAPQRPQRRVGSLFAYNNMSDVDYDELPVNTVSGPGGGSMLKKFV